MNVTGCLSEQSFEFSPDDRRALTLTAQAPTSQPDTRTWLVDAHAQLADLLPRSDRSALLTAHLTDASGDPIGVYNHFNVNARRLRKLLGNMNGIRFTAQGASQDYHIDTPAPHWPGFDDVWIPVQPGLALAGRLGFAVDPRGQKRSADCIVILPGFFGDNGVQRTQDLARFLVGAGFHVLALEIRGHGQTEARYPDMYHTFGVMETDDLMVVADWLQQYPQVHELGLIGYCWGANIALLTAWYENHDDTDVGRSIPPSLVAHLHDVPDRRRFQAGVIAFSPIVNWEKMMAELEQPRSYMSDPIYASIQQICRERCQRKGYEPVSGSLRQLIESEYNVLGVELDGGYEAGFSFLRLIDYQGEPAYDKLERARVPVLIVHAANDPLSPAQQIADLISTVDNPQVAALMLPDGGHVGFAAYAKAYYYNLIANFFDPTYGAAHSSRVEHTAIAGNVSKRRQPTTASESTVTR